MPDNSTPQRRLFPRKPCAVPVQVRAAGASYPMDCVTTDMSASGCYVKSLFVLPVGTAVELKITIDDVGIVAKGTVKTSDPGVGYGIGFTEISHESRAQLQHYLDGIEQDDSTTMTIIR